MDKLPLPPTDKDAYKLAEHYGAVLADATPSEEIVRAERSDEKFRLFVVRRTPRAPTT